MRRDKKDQILAVLPEKIRGILLNHGLDFEKIQEIRLREEQPLAVKKEGKEELFTHRVTKEELRETMEYVSNYSLYAYENELRQGFLTIEGGHRVGISGKIISEKEQIRNFQYITSITSGAIDRTSIIIPSAFGQKQAWSCICPNIRSDNPFL